MPPASPSPHSPCTALGSPTLSAHPCTEPRHRPELRARRTPGPAAVYSLSQLLSVVRQLLPGVSEVVRPPDVLPAGERRWERGCGAGRGVPSRAERCRSPAEVLHAAPPRLPELHVPPQRLLQVQHRRVLHHHHSCGQNPLSARGPAAPRPAPPRPAPPRSRMLSPSALQTRTVMACPYSSAT